VARNIYIIHENDEWLVPLRESFKKINAPFKEWHMDKKSFDFKESPPDGVFYNRMSASSHSRGHRYAPENTKDVLGWLEKDKKRIVNNSRALELEISKQKQYEELKKFKIKFPETYYAKDKKEIIECSKKFTKPFITKHNRGGRGLGVKYFNNTEELKVYINGNFENSVDGITLLQEYIESDTKIITRVEFVKGKFLYAVQVDASDGFELCPADECNIEEKFCPANPDGNKFMIIKNYINPEIEKYENLLKSNGIEIAGIEYIKSKDGAHYTYDINTNTNYNSIAERKSKLKGMDSIATFLYNELKK
tara:strand:- start:438 stop:1358 length:921 start_codon:yes stop_codon:yes gene_type:complete